MNGKYLCIPLRGKYGGTALVSEDAYPLVDGIYWYLGKNGYAHSLKYGTMHRRITAAEPAEFIDHQNFCRLDNRYENLRCATPQYNNRRRRKRENAPWPYKGVRKVGHRWQARISVNGKGIHLGSFRSPDEAARAYDDAAILHFGRGVAVTNFGGQ